MTCVSVHAIGVDSRGTLSKRKWRIATDVKYPSHIPRVFSHDAFGLVMEVAVITCIAVKLAFF